MKSALLLVAAVGLLAAGAAADETENGAQDERHEAHGVWYGVYRNYVGPIGASARSTCGSVRNGAAPHCFGNLFESVTRAEPILYVLTLEVRGDEVTGTMTAGPGVKFEDPRAAMKQVLGLPLEEGPSAPPASRAVQGQIENEQITLTVAASVADADAETAIAADVDVDRMRATIAMPSGAERIVRLDRCALDAASGSASGAEPATDAAAYCAVDAVWRRLSLEHGQPVDPNALGR